LGRHVINATEIETSAEIQVRHEKPREEARIVCGLLKEYAARPAELNTEFLDVTATPDVHWMARWAWLLDRSELIRKPLSNIISRGSGLLEHATLDSLTRDELGLRMREIEIQLHHVLRLSHELRQSHEYKRAADQVKKLRLAAGLNAMKGGPLDPD
jgi:hypothetical protein